MVERTPGTRGFSVVPKRWVVERTFGWICWNRRMSKDYERKVPPLRNTDPGGDVEAAPGSFGVQELTGSQMGNERTSDFPDDRFTTVDK